MVAPLDSNSQAGNQGQPTPATSEPQSVQPPSTSAPASSPDQVRTLVNQIVSEALQNPDILKGMKDRRFNQIQRTLDEVSPVLERVKGILTPEQQTQFAQIQRDAEFDQLKQAVFGNQQTQTGAPQGGTQGGAALDAEAVITSLKFEPNDPALAALKIKHAANPQALVQAAADLRLSQLTSPSPTPGTALSQTGNATTGLTEDQIAEKGLLLEQLYKNYSQNRPQIEAILKDLEAAGVTRRRPGT